MSNQTNYGPIEWGLFPFNITVPAEVASKGVYAAVFGLLGPGATPPQVYLSTQPSGSYTIGFSSLLSSNTALQQGLLNQTFSVTETQGFNPLGGTLLITQTVSGSQQIIMQATVSYVTFSNGTFEGVEVISGSGGQPVEPYSNMAYFFNSNSATVIALGVPTWELCSNLTVGTTLSMITVFEPGSSYSESATTVIQLPLSGGDNGANDISSGELVLFVGTNSGIVVNSAQELSVPTLNSNPYDTFALFEWGLSGDLSVNSGGSIDYDVSAIDQVGFPFSVTASINGGTPPQPFDKGIGFLQNRTQLFDGFTPYLESLPTSANALPYITLAPENSLFSKRITAPQDWLEAVVQAGPIMLTEPVGLSGLALIQSFVPTTGAVNFTYSINTNSSTIVITSGNGYTSPPQLLLTAPTSGTTAMATATINNTGISSVTITNAGSGYTATPLVTVSAPPANGIQAAVNVQLAPLSFYYAVTALRAEVSITNGGSGYATAPAVQFSAPETTGGQNLEGFAIINGSGVVTGVYVTNPGSGYTSVPTIQFSSSSGQGATATVTFVESMLSNPLPAQLPPGYFSVINWYPYPAASAYNIYRNTSDDFSSGSVLLNSSPYSPAPFTGSTSGAISSGASSMIVTTNLLATPAAQGTLVIGSGADQSFFQYSAVSTGVSPYTFTGTLFTTKDSIPTDTNVQLLLNIVDAGGAASSQTPPMNNYNYEPLNQYFTGAIKDFFDYYTTNTFILDMAGDTSGRWTGKTINLPVGGTTYTVLQLTCGEGIYGNNCNGQTVNIYQPFFTENINADAVPGISLQPAPSWLTNPTESGSSMVFGADGVFDLPDNAGAVIPKNASSASSAIVKDLMNPINIALNRGLTPRKINGNWTNVLPPNYWAPNGLSPITFSTSSEGGTLVAGTYYYAVTGVNISNTSSKYDAYAIGETIPSNIMTVSIDSGGTSSVTLTVPNTGALTYASFNIYRGSSPQSMMLIKTIAASGNAITSFTDTGLANGTVAPSMTMYATDQSVNLYAAYLHQLSVSINGLAYATPYDDQGGFSSNVQLVYGGTTPNPPQSLNIMLLPWE